MALQRQLATLRLRLQHALNAQRRGPHEVRGRGRAHTFAEHRSYVPGDEVRHVDWRASARRGRTQLKVFAREAQATLELVLDATGSMGYRGYAEPQDGEAKWVEARVIAYALGTLALGQHDAVGLSVWHAETRRLLACATGAPQRRRLHLALARLRPGGAGELDAAAPCLGGRPRRRRTVVIGDFLGGPGPDGRHGPSADAQACAAAACALVRRGHEVDAVHLVHPDEVALFAADAVTLVDCESEDEVALAVGEARTTYVARAHAHAEELAGALRAGGVRYVRHTVGTGLAATLGRLAQPRVSGR